MIDPNNDADMQTAEMMAAALTAYRGCCAICEEALEPLDPRWAGESWPPIVDSTGARVGRMTAEQMADSVGPVADGLPYHARCLEASAW